MIGAARMAILFSTLFFIAPPSDRPPYLYGWVRFRGPKVARSSTAPRIYRLPRRSRILRQIIGAARMSNLLSMVFMGSPGSGT
jgi:hypothetical protein